MRLIIFIWFFLMLVFSTSGYTDSLTSLYGCPHDTDNQDELAMPLTVHRRGLPDLWCYYRLGNRTPVLPHHNVGYRPTSACARTSWQRIGGESPLCGKV
jgi:hypothetical protein